MAIQVLRSPPADVAKALSDGIAEFNRATIPDLESNEDEVRFHVVARSENGELIGGVRASCYWNTLHIELLWLSEQARGSGTGSDLVAAAEAFAGDLQCNLALVETTSWQARPFYERNGYELMASLEGRPKGHTTHYLRKTLKDESV